MSDSFFVYLDWTLEDPPRCFYVGKGKALRVRKRDRNELWKRIANKYGWRREVVYETLDEREAYTYETTLITHFATYECWGANHTIGGSEVMSGRRHTDAAKEKCRIASRGNKNSLGRKMSDEERQKHCGVNHHYYGKKLSSGHIEKNRMANSGENNAQAKLTRNDVEEIRVSYATGGFSKRTLARKFNVSSTLIHYIIIGKLWKKS